VLDYFTENNGQFLVMDYIDGENLGVWLTRRQRAFPWRAVLKWADQLLDALNNLMLHGSMSAAMRQSIKGAVSAISATNAISRVRTAVYLIATSSQYQVQR
jgi:serine/threonine protein kinase